MDSKPFVTCLCISSFEFDTFAYISRMHRTDYLPISSKKKEVGIALKIAVKKNETIKQSTTCRDDYCKY